MGSLLHLRRQRRGRRSSVNSDRFRQWKNRLVALVVFLLLLGIAGIFAEL
jgi:hypothetical protein